MKVTYYNAGNVKIGERTTGGTGRPSPDSIIAGYVERTTQRADNLSCIVAMTGDSATIRRRSDGAHMATALIESATERRYLDLMADEAASFAS